MKISNLGRGHFTPGGQCDASHASGSRFDSGARSTSLAARKPDTLNAADRPARPPDALTAQRSARLRNRRAPPRRSGTRSIEQCADGLRKFEDSSGSGRAASSRRPIIWKGQLGSRWQRAAERPRGTSASLGFLDSADSARNDARKSLRKQVVKQTAFRPHRAAAN
jgi:hypothetical protein